MKRQEFIGCAVPALDGACTQGDTMDELKYMLIDLAKICTEEK